MTLAFILSIAILTLLILLAAGSLLNLSSHPHWLVRGWDFPRVQIVVIAWLLCGMYVALRYSANDENTLSAWPFAVLAVSLTLWHGFRILPYTTVWPSQSASTPVLSLQRQELNRRSIRFVMTNVEMENDRHSLWIRTMQAANPDVILAVEMNQRWINAISDYSESFPFRVVEPRDNWYGMTLLSRLPIEKHEVRHLVQADIPSIDATIRLDDDERVRFIGVHPRPPEPVRGNHATARDAELTLWGQELASDDGPVVIGGDLNDVAWSQTSRLFLRTSGLLDPRRGRGFFNTFHADHWYMRFPLDHIFHSPHFTINRIECLRSVGSDHFPILIELQYAPAEQDNNPELARKDSDRSEINERVIRAEENEDLHGETIDCEESHAGLHSDHRVS